MKENKFMKTSKKVKEMVVGVEQQINNEVSAHRALLQAEPLNLELVHLLRLKKEN